MRATQWLLALLLLVTPSVALAIDRNCNGILLEDEVLVDLTDPFCAANLALNGSPIPTADDYFNYADFGCLYPLAEGNDIDGDGFGEGNMSVPSAVGGPLQSIVLLCDNCPAHFNPLQVDSDNDGEGDACDVCSVGGGNIDGDGHGDGCDNCPEHVNNDQSDVDTDLIGDVCDNCPDQSNVLQDDVDADGVGDVCDNCVVVSNTAQLDADGDGRGNTCDVCPYTADPGQLDSDNDGVGDACDGCPFHADSDQVDLDGDGVGDVCDVCPGVPDDQLDSDADGIGDGCDPCPDRFDPAPVDTDEDGVGNACDVCPADFDPLQTDSDGDGVGDKCDLCTQVADERQLDSDGDGIGNACDRCPLDNDAFQEDTDGDGVGDICDNCPLIPNGGQADTDGDGAGDACEPGFLIRGGGRGCATGPSGGSGLAVLMGVWMVVLRRRRRVGDSANQPARRGRTCGLVGLCLVAAGLSGCPPAGGSTEPCSTLGSRISLDLVGGTDVAGAAYFGSFASWAVGTNEFQAEPETYEVDFLASDAADASKVPDLAALGDLALVHTPQVVSEWSSTPSRLLITDTTLEDLQVLSSRQGTFESMGWSVGPGDTECSDRDELLPCDWESGVCVALSRTFTRGGESVELFPGQSAEVGDQTVTYAFGSRAVGDQGEDVFNLDSFTILIVRTSLL